MPYTTYTNSMPNYHSNMYQYDLRNSNIYRYNRQMPPMGNRPVGFGGGFVLPFALGFLSAPLLLGPRPRPYYRPPYGPYPYYY